MDDPCECPPIEKLYGHPWDTLVRFDSIACYCASYSCPSTQYDAERRLCDRVNETGSGQVMRIIGYGLARVTFKDGNALLSWLFEEVGGNTQRPRR